jgi:tungstate transport system ATP-binding protein
MMLPLQLTNVCLSINKHHLLKNISVTLNENTRTFILGANGAGKSLFLRLCHGLLPPSSGNIAWNTDAKTAQQKQSMVFQRPVMLERTVAQNISYALACKKIGHSKEWPNLIKNALAQVELLHLINTPAQLLSGGELQRVALARAIITQPSVLLLDEPTASLDPAATLLAEKIIQQVSENGTKIIMTTHNLAQAQRLADDVLFMHQGKIVEQALARDFFTAPQTAEAQLFLRVEK